MPVPPFIAALRARIGHDLLQLSGTTAVVHDAGGRVLLTRRADTGRWALVSGIPEPGEQPAAAIVREVAEETGLDVVVERMLAVVVLPPMTYPHGDRCQFTDHAFACRAAPGARPRVADEENLDVRWWPREDLPELPGWQQRLVALADADGPVFFER